MLIIDSHCHLDDARFDHDRDEVIARSQAVGIERFVVPAVDRQGWSSIQQLAARHHVISPAFGLHPWFCDRHQPSDLAQLPDYLDHAVAIGECGLDGSNLCRFDLQQQLPWFQAQLQIASDVQLPLIIHAHRAVDAVIQQLKKFPNLSGVVHSFSGSPEQAAELIKHGFYIGIGGMVTHPKAKRVAAVVQMIAPERLLIESDAPDQPPASHRGRRNEPAFLIEIVERIATLRGMDAGHLAEITTNNCRELFSI